MKVLGISGSPRKGNTDAAVQACLEEISSAGIETEFLALHDLNIKMCDGCRACGTETPCKIKDDMHSVYRKCIEADAIVIGSPTYYAAVSGLLKTFMDRSLYLRRSGMKLSSKLCGAIAVGASRNGGQELVCSQIHNWALLQEMLVVSDKKTAHFGGIVVANQLDDWKKDEAGMETVRNLGKKMAEVLKKYHG